MRLKIPQAESKGVWGGGGGYDTPLAISVGFFQNFGDFSRQSGEVTLRCVSLMQNALLYMHNI